MGARGEDLLVGALCAVLALLVARRIWMALRIGEIPLYRTRLSKAEAGPAKFGLLVAVNVALFVLLAVIAADLLFRLELRNHVLSS